MRLFNVKFILAIYFQLIMGIAFAQKPGGTTLEVELWLKSDEIMSANNASVTSWQDKSGKGRDHTRYSNHGVPTLDKVNMMNFHPSLHFENGAANTKLVYPNHFVNGGRSYYTFYVSRLNSADNSYGVVYTFNEGRQNENGWRYGNPWMRTDDHLVATNTPPLMGGMVSTFRTNTTTSVDQLFFNGGWLASMSNARAMNAGSGSSVIGNENLATTYPFYGHIQEIIVLSTSAGLPLNTTEIEKVHTYLSLKYGVGLNDTNRLKNSSGQNIWDATGINLNYRSNLFGIGKDSGSGLDQKQSVNYNNKFATVFLGSLAALNKENTSNLNDNTFLIFGSNGLKGTAPYNYLPGTSFRNGSISTEVNKITKTILKATTYGQSSFTVNIRPERTASYVLVSQNATFAPSSTRIYPLDNNKVANDVVVNHNDYIAYAYYQTAPGGINDGLRVWLNAAEENVDVSGDNVDVWRDLTSHGNDYSVAAVDFSDKTNPKYWKAYGLMNYQPAVSFDLTSYLAIAGNGSSISKPMSTDAPSGFTSFVLYYSAPSTKSTYYTHGFGSTDPRSTTNRYPAMGFDAADKQGRIRNNGSGQTDNNGTLAGFSDNSTNLQMIRTTKANGVNNAGTIVYDFGGWQDYLSPTGEFGDGFKMANGGTLGGASRASGSFVGQISEVIFYEKALSKVEEDRVRTYLGMKYGITLDQDKINPYPNYDYILSDNKTKVWQGNQSPNFAYHNNVFGLVRDDSQGLNLFRSRATTYDGIITLMTEGSNLSGENGAQFDNLNGLFVGDDKGPLTSQNLTGANVCGEIDETLSQGRIWLAENTSENMSSPTPKTVTLSVGGGMFPYDGGGYQVYLLVADNIAKLRSNQWDQIIPMNYTNETTQSQFGSHQVDFTFYGKNKYFSFGAKRVQGVCTTCDFKGTRRLEFTKSIWPKGSLSNTYQLDDDLTATVNVSLQQPSEWASRSYPRASSRKSLREYRKKRIR